MKSMEGNSASGIFEELTVDLRRVPSDRWRLTPLQCKQARELLAMYTADLGLRSDASEFLTSRGKILSVPIIGKRWNPFLGRWNFR